MKTEDIIVILACIYLGYNICWLRQVCKYGDLMHKRDKKEL